MEIADLAAVITGGASGLGAATAAMLVEAGARVSLFDIDAATGAKYAAKIGAAFHHVDVTKDDQVEVGFQAAAAEHGPARLLVSCAGVAPSIRMWRHEGLHPMDVYRHVIETNLTATFCGMRAFFDDVRKLPLLGEERGLIINTASIAAFDGQLGHAAYAASKAGIVGMTLPMARDLARSGIRVMCIAPGLFMTPMLADVPGVSRFGLGSQVPHPNRPGEPCEFAQLVGTIIRNPLLNGEVIRLDGAQRLAPY